MYDYTYYGDYGSSASSLLDGFAVLGKLLFIGTIVSILVLVSFWKIFKKAGKKGWEAIVPIYNTIVLLEITNLPTWYVVLFFIPFANIYAIVKVYIELAKKFGKDTGFGVLTLFFPVICLPILAFSKCSYNNENKINTVSNNSVNNNVNNMNNMNQVNNMNNMNQVNNMNTVNTIPNTEPVNNVTNNTNNDVYSFNSMSDIQTVNQNTNNINQNMEQNINNTQVNNNINEVPSVTPVMPLNNDANNNQNNMFQ